MEKAVCNLIIGRGNIEAWYDRIEAVLGTDMESWSLEEQMESDWKFHYMLISAAENQLWICISEAISKIYQEWIVDVLNDADSDMRCRIYKSHEAILLALRKGSREAVEKAIDNHYNLLVQS